ncbi:DUF1501 domain-containing protein [cf. Phormidesmis sp. LEGE 11477]|uniref:DUF1501 domain-containing protein n=1 Tax=cf. Phormidesmis sp. LEGE 11477 TaxID=1828680 RepID=UPI0018802126|nr:DUF1501 domain-containing protein [cf. Phormidesmis sp. LEGE 11477]MBE9060467.1 DUF1501 domain-containing protein [cf. Phormidesmis sp. LEGE 11477]
MRRRQLLRQTALAGASSLVALGAHGWAWRSEAQTSGNTAGTRMPRLVVVMLRGGIDGLNVVVPHQDLDYYEARPTIAIAKPGETNGALDLDGQFGLNPDLEPLMAQWQAGNLAFVQAAGSPVASRSHFQAQDYIETGTPGEASTSIGWLNRLLAFLPNGTPTTGLNVGSGGTLPLILSGPQTVANLKLTDQGSPPMAIDRPQLRTAFDQMYAGDDRIARVYQDGRTARDVLLTEVNNENMEASRGAPKPTRFARSTRRLAQLMKSDANTQVAFMELGGWDSHVGERGILRRFLPLVGTGLATLAQDLGPLYQDTVVVVMSEFGRTVLENGNAGTDHGHGNVIWLMGGGLRGQQVYGQWPGLDLSERYESRDLAVTTDYRDVLESVLRPHFGLDDQAIAQIFPNHQAQSRLELLS